VEFVQFDNMKYYIRGGIGDLLQHYWFIKTYPNNEYIVHTHFKQAKDIFEHLKASNYHIYQFEDLESHNDQVDVIKSEHAKEDQSNIAETPRAYYSSFDFGDEADLKALQAVQSFNNKQKIIGIHPFRSGFANSVYNQFNLPAKQIPLEIVESIITDSFNYLIFGSPSELASYGLKEKENIKFVSFDNILHSLSTVKHCSTLIGLDSCFKSMSSMQNINTICIIGDFPDPTRDNCFINRYVNDGVMHVAKIKNIEQEANQIIEFIKNNIK